MIISADAVAAAAIERAIFRLKRLRAVTARARARLNAAWLAMSRCAECIAMTPEKYASAPWRKRGLPADAWDGKHHFYFSWDRDPLDPRKWILGPDDVPANQELGERALAAEWHWEHRGRRVNALVDAFESELRKAVES